MTAPTREEFSERLLKGSVKKSYAPIVDIDWDAPLDPDKYFLPPKTVSLYGTPLWDKMTREQRIELSRQEFVNTLSAGIWFENILNQALLRKMMHQDPTARATHYELTELGDETRHMIMFGKAIERVGAKPVRPRLYQRIIINALPLTFRGSVLWVAALIGEEIFDSLQRQMMDDGCASEPRPCGGSTSCGWPISTASAACSSDICSPIACRIAEPDSTPVRRAASHGTVRTATRSR
jgi:P-aminobenzoate N-oxygenase AurF